MEILTLYKIKELLIFGLHRDILIIVFKIFQGCMLKYFVMKSYIGYLLWNNMGGMEADGVTASLPTHE